MKIMVAYDGTLQAKKALQYGIGKARDGQGEIVVLSVFDRPLLQEYGASPNAWAAAHAEFRASVAEACDMLREQAPGITASVFTAEGDPETAVLDLAVREKANLLLCPSPYRRIIAQYAAAGGERLSAEGVCRAEVIGAQ